MSLYFYTERLIDALEEFGALFGAGIIAYHYASKPVLEDGVEIPGRPKRHKTRNGGPVEMTWAELLRHLLQNRKLRPTARRWVHPEGEDATDRFTIDIDVDESAELHEGRRVFSLVAGVLGKPESATRSRGGLGYNLTYFLDGVHPTAEVKAAVLRLFAGLKLQEGTADDYEFFPKVGTAMCAIPFGMNMLPCTKKAHTLRLSGVRSLMRWHTACKKRGDLRRIALANLQKLAQERGAEPVVTSPQKLPKKNRRKAGSGQPSPWHRKPRPPQYVTVDFRLFQKYGLTDPGQRYDAQFLLNQYAHQVLRLSGEDAVEFAIEELEKHHNDQSKDFPHAPEHARGNLRWLAKEYTFSGDREIEQPEQPEKPPDPPCASPEDFMAAIDLVLRYDKRVKNWAKRHGVKHANRFRKDLLSFVVHCVGYARANGTTNKHGLLVAEIPKKTMQAWPFCASKSHVYSRFLRNLHVGWLRYKYIEGTKCNGYLLQHEPTGKPKQLASAKDFDTLCRNHLDEQTGPLFFASGWTRFRDR